MIAAAVGRGILARRPWQNLPALPTLLAEFGGRLPVVTVLIEPFFNLANSRLQKHFQSCPRLIKSYLWATERADILRRGPERFRQGRLPKSALIDRVIVYESI